MEERAAQQGANAVIGVDIDYEVLGADNGMLMVTASGTAVVGPLVLWAEERTAGNISAVCWNV